MHGTPTTTIRQAKLLGHAGSDVGRQLRTLVVLERAADYGDHLLVDAQRTRALPEADALAEAG